MVSKFSGGDEKMSYELQINGLIDVRSLPKRQPKLSLLQKFIKYFSNKRGN